MNEKVDNKVNMTVGTGDIKNSNVNIKNSNSSIVSMIEDNTGGISAIRVLMLAWGLGVFIIWGFATVTAVIHGIYVVPTIPESVVTILLGVVGSKVVQRPFEK